MEWAILIFTSINILFCGFIIGACYRLQKDIKYNNIPIICENNKWYFADEYWEGKKHGPYNSKKEAVKARNKYVDILN